MSFLKELKRRNVIRVAIAYLLIAWVLLQASDFALDLIDAPNWVIQALFSLAAIGLPAVMLFSWVFEMTPEGIKREAEIERDDSITHQTGRKLDRVIIGVLAVAVVYLLVDKLVIQKGVQPGPAVQTASETAEVDETPSVAVLPFVNMSDDKQNEYFSDGLTETLLHMLAQLPDLQVAARTSSFAFKGENRSVAEIAEILGVAHILEGSVQRAGERVRVTAQLVRANDGFHVWSQNYTRPVADIFAIQDEIAADVADALGMSLLGSGPAAIKGVETTDLTAYDPYLKGLEQQALNSYGSLEKAEAYFKQALAQDPEFTDARLALVRNYHAMFWTGLIDAEETQAKINPLLDQVRKQDPDSRLAQAYQLLLDARTSDSRVTREVASERIRKLQGLLALMPTETFIREATANAVFFVLEQEDEAIALLEAGLMIDPLDAGMYRVRGRLLMIEDELQASEASLLKSLELEPDDPNTYSWLSDLEKRKNNLPAALEWMRRATEVDPQDHELAVEIARDLYDLNLTEEAAPWSAKVHALVPGSEIARQIDMEYTYSSGDYTQTASMGESLIADKIENRRGAFFMVAFTYADAMMKLGKSREGYDFLVSLRPEITQFETLPEDARGVAMQRVALSLSASFAEPAEYRANWNNNALARDAQGWSWRDEGSGALTVHYLAQGELEKAVEHHLEHRLNAPVAQSLNRHKPFLTDVFRELDDDPRIIARHAEREREFIQTREQVIAMLQQPEWNP